MINPVNMTVRQWADSVVLSIGDGWGVGRLDSELDWQDWGVSLVRAFATQNLPNPYQFSGWKEWAERIYPALEAVT